ncbi:unnamed protein product, partial [Prorocentrum cordatum]
GLPAQPASRRGCDRCRCDAPRLAARHGRGRLRCGARQVAHSAAAGRGSRRCHLRTSARPAPCRRSPRVAPRSPLPGRLRPPLAHSTGAPARPRRSPGPEVPAGCRPRRPRRQAGCRGNGDPCQGGDDSPAPPEVSERLGQDRRRRRGLAPQGRAFSRPRAAHQPRGARQDPGGVRAGALLRRPGGRPPVASRRAHPPGVAQGGARGGPRPLPAGRHGSHRGAAGEAEGPAAGRLLPAPGGAQHPAGRRRRRRRGDGQVRRLRADSRQSPRGRWTNVPPKADGGAAGGRGDVGLCKALPDPGAREFRAPLQEDCCRRRPGRAAPRATQAAPQRPERGSARPPPFDCRGPGARPLGGEGQRRTTPKAAVSLPRPV